MPNYFLVTIFGVLMVPGLVGIILPAIPGIPYMFLIAVIYGLLTKWNTLGWVELSVLAGLVLISMLVDYFSGSLGAKLGGAGKKAFGAGLIGLIVGTLLLPPFGGLAGMFLAILAAELMDYKSRAAAFKAATGSVLGAVSGVVVNLILALIFMAVFIFTALS